MSGPADPPRAAVVRPLWFAAGTLLFFGLGVGVGVAVRGVLLDRGAPPPAALLFGATAGAAGAWFAFHVGRHAASRHGRVRAG